MEAILDYVQEKYIIRGALSLSLLTSNTIVPLSVVAAAAEIEPSRSLVTNSTSILEKINSNYTPTSTLEKDLNTVEENYIISSEDLAALNAQLFPTQPGKFLHDVCWRRLPQKHSQSIIGKGKPLNSFSFSCISRY
mgnify:CR=1 FL=1